MAKLVKASDCKPEIAGSTPAESSIKRGGVNGSMIDSKSIGWGSSPYFSAILQGII